MKTKFTIAAALFAASFSVQAADIAAGKAKAEAQCAACHAVEGNASSCTSHHRWTCLGDQGDTLAPTAREAAALSETACKIRNLQTLLMISRSLKGRPQTPND